MDENIAIALKDVEKERLERDIKHLENLKKNKGKSASVFGLRDTVLGKKKVTPEQMILKDPETDEEVNTPDGIKDIIMLR